MAAGGREIERKFVLDGVPEAAAGRRGAKVRQGYVAVTAGGTEVRVRRECRRHRLTIKEGRGESRGEHEVDLSPAQFAALWPLTRGRRVRKVRLEIPHGGLTVQVDVYRGRLRGLVVAEVEFPDEAAARRFEPPAWLGREVTEDDRYANRELARRGAPARGG